MRHPNITVQELDKGTKERAEQIARIFSSIPADKEGIFLERPFGACFRPCSRRRSDRDPGDGAQSSVSRRFRKAAGAAEKQIRRKRENGI